MALALYVGMLKLSALIVAVAVTTGCVTDGQADDASAHFTPASDRSVASLTPLTKRPVPALQPDGTYRVVARWDLTSAIAGDSLGDTLATLLIAEAVGALGLPSWWQGDAENALSSLAHDPLANTIDANTPAVVNSSNGILAQLSEILGNVEVVSTVSLHTTSDAAVLFGSEQVTAVRLHYDGRSVEVPVAQLATVAGAGSIQSDIVATMTGRDRLAIAMHTFAMKTDPLAAFGLDGLLSISDVTAYAEQVIDCDAAVAALTGGNGVSISFAGQSVSIGDGTLVSACEAVRGEALELVLGFTQTELGVATGGPVLLRDDSGNTIVDRLFADTGYSGVITSLPESVQAPFAIELVGTRE